jgi:hypothetical protein
MVKMHWPCSKKNIRAIEMRITSHSPMLLFLLCMGEIAPYRIRVGFMALLVLRFITRSPWSSNSSGCSEWKKTFSNSNVKNSLNFQTGSIIGAIKYDILLDDRTWWIHNVVGEIILTWRRNGVFKWDRPWWGTSAIRAPGRIHEGTHEATTIWLDDGHKVRSTLG